MLVLSRQRNGQIIVRHNKQAVLITVVDIQGDKVRLGFEAPNDFEIHRYEVYEQIKRKRESCESPSSESVG
jgi:carbon storage regulator